jgi:hypothetical protein
MSEKYAFFVYFHYIKRRFVNYIDYITLSGIVNNELGGRGRKLGYSLLFQNVLGGTERNRKKSHRVVFSVGLNKGTLEKEVRVLISLFRHLVHFFY